MIRELLDAPQNDGKESTPGDVEDESVGYCCPLCGGPLTPRYSIPSPTVAEIMAMPIRGKLRQKMLEMEFT